MLRVADEVGRLTTDPFAHALPKGRRANGRGGCWFGHRWRCPLGYSSRGGEKSAAWTPTLFLVLPSHRPVGRWCFLGVDEEINSMTHALVFVSAKGLCGCAIRRSDRAHRVVVAVSAGPGTVCSADPRVASSTPPPSKSPGCSRRFRLQGRPPRVRRAGAATNCSLVRRPVRRGALPRRPDH